MELCLLGTGGMYPLPHRALTSLYVRSGGEALLIDCGEGTQTAIRRAGLRFKPIGTLLLTHFHADHVSGLPGLLLTMGNEGRCEPLHIYGPMGLAQVVQAARVIVPQLPFAVELHELPVGQCACFACGGLTVDAFPTEHGVDGFGYRLRLDRAGRFDTQRAQRLGIPVRLWSVLQKGMAAEGFLPQDVLGPPRRGLSVLYATDTRPVPAIAQYGCEADLLILEGIYGEDDKLERAQHYGHMLMSEAAQLAAEARAKRLWLTHYSPSVTDPDAYVERLRTLFAPICAAQDGMRLTLHFDDEA